MTNFNIPQWNRRVLSRSHKGSSLRAIQCYEFENILTDSQPFSTQYYVPNDRNFSMYATHFERHFSGLVNAGFPGKPVIHQDAQLSITGQALTSIGIATNADDWGERDVVGYIGNFNLRTILVPRKRDPGVYKFNDILLKYDVFIGHYNVVGHTNKQDYYPFGASEAGSYRLVVDIDGKVLWKLPGSGSTTDAKAPIMGRIGNWVIKTVVKQGIKSIFKI